MEIEGRKAVSSAYSQGTWSTMHTSTAQCYFAHHSSSMFTLRSFSLLSHSLYWKSVCHLHTPWTILMMLTMVPICYILALSDIHSLQIWRFCTEKLRLTGLINVKLILSFQMYLCYSIVLSTSWPPDLGLECDMKVFFSLLIREFLLLL